MFSYVDTDITVIINITVICITCLVLLIGGEYPFKKAIKDVDNFAIKMLMGFSQMIFCIFAFFGCIIMGTSAMSIGKGIIEFIINLY